MKNIVRKINCLWQRLNWKYYWGDPLDVRYFLCEELSGLKNKKVLDIACGPGIVMSCLDKSNEVIGVELDGELVKVAREINPEAEIIRGDCFGPNGFGPRNDEHDIIILANVLPKHDFASEHQPEELINLAWRLLKPGGKLFLTTPNATNSFYKNRGKFVNHDYLKKLFDEKKWDYQINFWNPFPIQAGHILKYIPGIFILLQWLRSKKIGEPVAFYLEAIKK